MGFFKKIKKSFKKVTKAVSKPIKKVAKTVEKVAKPVVKKALPIAGTAIGAYLGGPAGAAVGNWLQNTAGLGSGLSKTLGGVVDRTIQDMGSDFGSALSGSGSGSYEYGGIPNLGGYSGSSGARAPSTVMPSTPPAASAGDIGSGLSQVKNIETPIKSATEQGKDTRAYLAAAYPELNAWERSGTGGTMFGSEMTGDIQSQEQANKQLSSTMLLQKQAMEKDYNLAKLKALTDLQINANNNETALKGALIGSQTNLETAGIASQTSRANTWDTIQLGYKNSQIAQDRLSADVNKIAADTELSKQNKEESIARTIYTYAQNNNIELTGKQIQAMTQQALAAATESGARTKLTGEQTESERIKQGGYKQMNENLKYGQGWMSGVNSFGNFGESGLDAIGDWFGSLFSDDANGVKGSMTPYRN